MFRLEPKTFMGERRRSWVSQDLCVDLSHYTVNSEVNKHRHSDAFFCFVLDGCFVERMDARRETFQPGSLVYHSAGCEHSNQWQEDGSCLHIELAAGYFEGTNHAALTSNPLQVIAGRPCEIARSIHRELLHTDTASNLIFEGLALLLLGEALRETTRERNVPRWLRLLHARLHEEHALVPSLQQLAIEAGVHPTHLASSFQKHYGVSVGEFVRIRRVEEARRLLTKTELPLGEVAIVLGFSDQSHFCRTFKKQTLFSPMEYRRIFSKNPNPVQ